MNVNNQKEHRNYLFLSGCPRSGTTEIINVLNRHPAVAIGMERFKYVIRDRLQEYQQHLFEPDNLVRAAEEDTNILPRSPAMRNHYALLKSKFEVGGVVFVGDKLPFLFRHWETIEERFDSPLWIIMHRSPYAIAASYRRRARNPEDKAWTEDRDHRLGVQHWVESYRWMESMRGEIPDRVFVCEYERFYSGDVDALAQVFGFLGLSVVPEVESYFRDTTAGWEQRAQRGVELTADEVEYVDNYLSREEGVVFTPTSGMREVPRP